MKKKWIVWFYMYYAEVWPNDADWMANSVHPDQTAPEGASVWSGSTLFAQTSLGKYLGSLQ